MRWGFAECERWLYAGFVADSIDTAGEIYGEVGVESKASFKFRDENGKRDYKSFGLTTEAKASGCLAKGKASGNIGYLRGEAAGVLLTGTVSGTAKATLWDDGKFNPSLGVGAKAEASAAKGNAEVRVGAEQYGVYGKAEGDALHAEAEAEAGVGYIGKGKDGSAQYGVSAKASAMASVAQGSVKGGITLFGVDIDVGVKGYAVAAGVEAGGSISTKGVKAKIGGALAIGGGLEVSVDWSDAEWIGDAADAINGFDMVPVSWNPKYKGIGDLYLHMKSSAGNEGIGIPT